VNLTHNPGYDSLPVVSPDGEIAFHSDRGGLLRIYLMEADGSNPHALMNSFTRGPVWSRDGGHLAYLLGGDIYVVDARCDRLPEGCQQTARNITRSSTLRDWYPVWSPDGHRMLFHSDRSIRPMVFLTNIDCPVTSDTCTRPLTTELHFSLLPDWSSDGEYITLLSSDSGRMELYLLDRSGKVVRPLTGKLGQIYSPRWRPA
jgi:TolB protein